MKNKILITESKLINVVKSVLYEIKENKKNIYIKKIKNIIHNINNENTINKKEKHKILNKIMSLIKNNYNNIEIEVSEDATSDSGGSSSSAGTPGVWSSGRAFGKTYMNDPKYKWESGLTRGKGNQLK